MSTLGEIPLLQLCKCVFVFTPQFAMKTQHCFDLGSQLKDAACCLLSSPAQGPGDSSTESSGSGGHARVFLTIFQTCFSPEAFPSSFHRAPQLSLETCTAPENLVGLSPSYAPYKHHLNFLFLRCFGHLLLQINGWPLSWRESTASIHPGLCSTLWSNSSSQLVSYITGSQGFRFFFSKSVFPALII